MELSVKQRIGFAPEDILQEVENQLRFEFKGRIRAINIEDYLENDEENKVFFIKIFVHRENRELLDNIFEVVYKVMLKHHFYPYFFVEVRDENKYYSEIESAERHMGRAKQSLAAAKCLYEEGFWPEVLSGCYMAMLHAVRSMQADYSIGRAIDPVDTLITLGDLCYMGKVEGYMHKNLAYALNEKYHVDSGIIYEASATEAMEALTRAEDFIAEIEQKIQVGNYS